MKKGNQLWKELTKDDDVWKREHLSAEETEKLVRQSRTRDKELVGLIENLKLGESYRIDVSKWKYKRVDSYQINRHFEEWGIPIKVGLRRISPESYLLIRKK